MGRRSFGDKTLKVSRKLRETAINWRNQETIVKEAKGWSAAVSAARRLGWGVVGTKAAVIVRCC